MINHNNKNNVNSNNLIYSNDNNNNNYYYNSKPILIQQKTSRNYRDFKTNRFAFKSFSFSVLSHACVITFPTAHFISRC